jgi:hypothetical protein
MTTVIKRKVLPSHPIITTNQTEKISVSIDQPAEEQDTTTQYEEMVVELDEIKAHETAIYNIVCKNGKVGTPVCSLISSDSMPPPQMKIKEIHDSNVFSVIIFNTECDKDRKLKLSYHTTIIQ